MMRQLKWVMVYLNCKENLHFRYFGVNFFYT
jgi:hypothetical protein